MALPIAMPASTHASMIVKAYAVGRRKITSMRNQMISRASDITPETKNTQSTNRRASCLVPRAGDGCREGACVPRASCRERQAARYAAITAMMPIAMLVAAAIWNERATPSSEMK